MPTSSIDALSSCETNDEFEIILLPECTASSPIKAIDPGHSHELVQLTTLSPHFPTLMTVYQTSIRQRETANKISSHNYVKSVDNYDLPDSEDSKLSKNSLSSLLCCSYPLVKLLQGLFTKQNSSPTLLTKTVKP